MAPNFVKLPELFCVTLARENYKILVPIHFTDILHIHVVLL